MSEENKDLPEEISSNSEETPATAEKTDVPTNEETNEATNQATESTEVEDNDSNEKESGIDSGTKKLIMGIIIGVVISLIVGVVIQLTATKDVLVKTKQGNITKDDLYAAMVDKFDAKSLLQNLVYEKVLEDDYAVTDKEIKVKIDELKQQFGSEFEDTIQQYGYMNEQQLKDDYRINMMKQKAATAKVKVTDEEIQKYYDEYVPKIQASHIIVADKKTADKVAKELKDGGDFAELAKKYSTDGSASKGGDLGFFSNTDMDETFYTAAAALKVGEVSSVVKTQFGYHIIKKTDEETKKPLAEMKDNIIENIKQSKVTEASYDESLNKIIKAANVKVTSNDFKSLFK